MPLLTNGLPHVIDQPKSLLPSPTSRFRRLISDIQTQLGPDDGITASDAVRLSLQDLLEKYHSDESAWQYCAFQDPSQTFTRNLVDRGNGSFNLVLKGTLTETRYAWPSTTAPSRPMQVTQTTSFHRDQVTYMADTLGLHKISNPDPREYAVSLHRMFLLPSPPLKALPTRSDAKSH
ncbi:MAG: hypothetical protein Q9177_004421 [Variospora cf. flavescens]